MKTVIITGGTKGLGADIALKFLKKKYNVIIGARNKDGLAKKKHENLKFYRMDVTLEKDHEKIINETIKWSKSIDCYVNCAGFSQWAPIAKVDEKLWNQMINTNLKGTFLGCKVASQYMKKDSVIINISSLAGKRGSSNNSVYCASKFGVNGLTQSLAKELGPNGIRVNAICSVYIETPGLLDALKSPLAPPMGQKTKVYLQNFANSQAALKRLPEGREVADLCLFLASKEASAITGQCINVDCGVLPQ